VYECRVLGRMLVRVLSQYRSHRATVHVWVVHSSRDRCRSSSRAVCAAARVTYPPGRTRSVCPNRVVTEQWNPSCRVRAAPVAGSGDPAGSPSVDHGTRTA